MKQVTVYTVDKSDRITSVNSTWNDFADKNDAKELTTDELIGTSIWDYIEGDETKHLYKHCFEKVRQLEKGIRIPSRCDSPEFRRFMNIEITPADEGDLEINCEIYHEEKRDQNIKFDRETIQDKNSLGMCSICNRVHITAGGWVEIEEALSKLNLLSEYWLPSIKPTVCEECTQQLENPDNI